ncbi:hypothetical protein D3C80_1158490 [compost metagenome]
MKNVLLLLLLMSIYSCLGIPKMPELDSDSKKELEGIKNYLKCDEIKQTYFSKTTDGKDYLSFTLEIYDVRRNNSNLDSINKVIFDLYQRNKYELNKCDQVNIYYFKEYTSALIRKAYFFDGNFKLIKVAYK